MKKNYTIIIALLLFSALNAKNKVLNVSPPPNTPPTIVAAAGQSTELWYCPGSPLANIEFIVGDRETLYKDLVVTFSSSNQDYIADSEIAAYPDPATFVTNGQRYLGITANTIIPPVFVNGFTDITVRVTDGAGLTATKVFRIYIVDSSQPTIVKTGDIASGYVDRYLSSYSCSYKLEDFTGNVTVSDDCTDTPAIVVTQVATLKGTTYNIGDIIQGQDGDVVEVTLTAEDLVGKTATTTFTITLQDETMPLLTIINSVVNEYLPVAATNCRFTIKDYTQGSFANVTLYEACSPGIIIIRQTPAAGTVVDYAGTNQEQTITFTCSDAAGNAASPVSFTVKVKDLTMPVVRTKDITVQLNASGTVSIGASDINNGSTDNCSITSYTLSKSTFTSANVGSNVITLTSTDFSGNSASNIATVVVQDKIAPTVLTKNITVQLNAAGIVSIVASDVNNGSNDACGIASYSIDKTSFSCSDTGSAKTVTLTVIDIYGNIGTGTALVTVKDQIAPVVITKNLTVQLNVLGTVTIVPADINNGSTDNCSISSYSLSKDTFTCANVGSNTVALTAKDASGNTSIAFATVTVQDVTAPVVVTKNIELVLDHGSVSIVLADVLVSATDACGVDVLSYTLSRDTFTIADVLAGSVTITVSATDINGNVGSAPATITFPIPITATQVITPNGDGINDTWMVENITNHQNSVVRVFNRWGSLVYSAKNYQNDWDGKLNGSDVTVPDGGSYYYQIDLKGTGNVDSEGWLYIISCSNVIAPTVITKNITVQLNVSGTVSIVPADVLVSVMDPCVVDVFSSYTLSRDTFTLTDVLASPITIYLTAKDIYGNSTVAPVIVTFTTNLSVDTYKKEKDITIYPNPTTSVLHLQFSNEVIIDKVLVRDLNGKIVVQQTKETSEINVEKLASGIYTIEANSGKEKFKTKFIKE